MNPAFVIFICILSTTVLCIIGVVWAIAWYTDNPRSRVSGGQVVVNLLAGVFIVCTLNTVLLVKYLEKHYSELLKEIS